MSDFNDIIKFAVENGILLDKCGDPTRYYDWGVYYDFCGMTPEQILEDMKKGGKSSSKTKVTITATVKEIDGAWKVAITTDKTLGEAISVTLNDLDAGTSEAVSMAEGSNSATTKNALSSKYAKVSLTVPAATTKYTYAGVAINPNGDGTFTLTYSENVNGKTTVLSTDKVKYGTEQTLSTNTKEGYTFSGWTVTNVEITSPTELTITFTMPESDVTATAVYSINQHVAHITFKETTDDVSLTYGENIKSYIEKQEAYKPGDDEVQSITMNGEIVDDKTTMPDNDVDITVTNTENVHTLHYTIGETTYYKDFTKSTWNNIISAATEEAIAQTPEGYTFKGLQPTYIEAPKTDVTVSAVYEINTYKLTYYVENVQSGVSESHNYGEELELRTKPKKTGYDLSGWTLPYETMPAHDVEVRAYWVAKQYTVTVAADSSNYLNIYTKVNDEEWVTGATEYTVNYGSKVEIKSDAKDPQKHFVNFISVNKKAVSENPYTINAITGDTAIQVSAADQSYNLTLTGDNAKFSINGSEPATAATATIKWNAYPTIECIPNEGYNFMYWSGSITSESNPVKLGAILEDTTITGKTIAIEYTITVSSDLHSTVSGGGNYHYGDTANIAASVTGDTFEFDYWEVNRGTSEPIKENPYEFTVTESKSFAAKTKYKDVTLTLSGEHVSFKISGETTSTKTVAYGTVLKVVANPEEGYKFVKWSDGITESTREITMTENLALNAEIEVIKLNIAVTAVTEGIVSVEANDETLGSGKTVSVEVDYGTELKLTATPNNGYEFTNWVVSEEYKPTNNPLNINPTEDQNILAIFTAKKYSLTLNVTNISGTTTEVYNKDVAYNTALTSITEFNQPAIEGYTFKWYTDNTYSTESSLTNMPAKATTLYGKYVEKPVEADKLYYGYASMIEINNL